MSASAEIALRAAIRAALAADPNVTGILNGAHIFDEAPDTANLPYVSFDDARTRDWSTATSLGAEHQVSMTIHTQGQGILEALQIAAAICESLRVSTLTLDGHHLILLRETGLSTGRRKRGRVTYATVNFRALTEAA